METARLWALLGHFDVEHGFRIDWVTGPDEYTAVDNNVYTNLMARGNRARGGGGGHGARRSRRRRRSSSTRSRCGCARPRSWRCRTTQRAGCRQTTVPSHGSPWTSRARLGRCPLLLHYLYFDIYRKQVVKQADLVQALYLTRDAFTSREKIANFEYYEPLTTRDSSLSATQQAVMAAETGHLQLAHDWGRRRSPTCRTCTTTRGTACTSPPWRGLDRRRRRASAGCATTTARLTFGPRLPPRITRMRFRVVYRGRRLTVAVTPEEATYRLEDGEPLEIRHHGKQVTVGSEDLVLEIRRRRGWTPSGSPPAANLVGAAAARGATSGRPGPGRRCRPRGRSRPRPRRAPLRRASWSASESGARQRRRAPLQLQHRARRGQQQEPGREGGEGGLPLRGQPPGGGEHHAARHEDRPQAVPVADLPSRSVRSASRAQRRPMA